MRATKLLVLVIVVAMIIATTGCAPAAVPPGVPSEYLIVPGKSIGPFLLGTTIESFKAKLGPPTSVHQLKFDWGEPLAHVWTKEDIAIFVFSYTDPARRGRVYEIILPTVKDRPAVTAKNMRYRTAEGLGIGSHRAEIHRVYGTPWFYAARSEYFHNGLVFTFAREGPNPDRAIQVGVFRPIPIAP